MTDVTIRKYRLSDFDTWNHFVAASKNGTFLFHRNFMEYHKDRFEDFSLLAEVEGKIVGLLPASVKNGHVTSHQGLTYGGWVTGEPMSTRLMMDVFLSLKTYLTTAGVKKLTYKRTPTIYHRYPSDEDAYALFLFNAQLIRRDVSTAIYLPSPYSLSDDRQRNYKLSQRRDVTIRQTDDFDQFYKILSEIFAARHDVKPTHSQAEIIKLSAHFPEHIKLYGAFDSQGDMLAGTWVFDTGSVIHTQYMVSSLTGRKVGALDALINWIKEDAGARRQYLNFGISTEDDGRTLNEGLIYQKEGFGGRAVVHDFYDVPLS